MLSNIFYEHTRCGFWNYVRIDYLHIMLSRLALYLICAHEVDLELLIFLTLFHKYTGIIYCLKDYMDLITDSLSLAFITSGSYWHPTGQFQSLFSNQNRFLLPLLTFQSINLLKGPRWSTCVEIQCSGRWHYLRVTLSETLSVSHRAGQAAFLCKPCLVLSILMLFAYYSWWRCRNLSLVILGTNLWLCVTVSSIFS